MIWRTCIVIVVIGRRMIFGIGIGHGRSGSSERLDTILSL